MEAVPDDVKINLDDSDCEYSGIGSIDNNPSNDDNDLMIKLLQIFSPSGTTVKYSINIFRQCR